MKKDQSQRNNNDGIKFNFGVWAWGWAWGWGKYFIIKKTFSLILLLLYCNKFDKTLSISQ